MRMDHTAVNNEPTDTAVPQGGAEGLPRPDVVTSIIQHQVHVGAPAQYETWLQTITPAAQGFPGHQGVDIIRPSTGADVYIIVLRFDTLMHLQDWLGSDTRRRLIAEIEPLLASNECVEI